MRSEDRAIKQQGLQTLGLIVKVDKQLVIKEDDDIGTIKDSANKDQMIKVSFHLVVGLTSLMTMHLKGFHWDLRDYHLGMARECAKQSPFSCKGLISLNNFPSPLVRKLKHHHENSMARNSLHHLHFKQ